MSVPLESFRGNFDQPVKILGLVGQFDYLIVSSPEYNRSESMIRSDIEGSVLNITPGVVAFYLILLFLTLASIQLIDDWIQGRKERISHRQSTMNIKGRSVVTIQSVSNKVPGKKVFWNLIRFFLSQGSGMQLPLKSQMAIFLTYACAIGILICLYNNHMSADLVSYKKPILLDTLQDVLDAGDSIKISFLEASNALGEFRDSPEGSIKRKLYQRSLAQWAPFKHKGDDYLHVYPSARMLEIVDSIKKWKMALLTSSIPANLALGLDCSREEDSSNLCSTMYVSSQRFMHDNQVQVGRLGIDPELEHRLTIAYRRLVESGLQEMTTRTVHELILQSVPLPGGQPKSLCLNIKVWSDENKEHTDTLLLEHFYTFFIHISYLFALATVVSFIEITVFWIGRLKRRKKVDVKVISVQRVCREDVREEKVIAKNTLTRAENEGGLKANKINPTQSKIETESKMVSKSTVKYSQNSSKVMQSKAKKNQIGIEVKTELESNQKNSQENIPKVAKVERKKGGKKE